MDHLSCCFLGRILSWVVVDCCSDSFSTCHMVLEAVPRSDCAKHLNYSPAPFLKIFFYERLINAAIVPLWEQRPFSLIHCSVKSRGWELGLCCSSPSQWSFCHVWCLTAKGGQSAHTRVCTVLHQWRLQTPACPKLQYALHTHTEFNFDHELHLAWRNSHDKNKHRVAVKLFQVMPGTSALLIRSGSKPYFVAADSPTPCSFLSSLYWWTGCCGWNLPGRWNQLP